MENIHKRIGIIGGGQLGQMMILEAKKMGFYITVLDPTEKCPAHSIADEHIIADFDNEKAIRMLAERSDVITYEFEHIGADILERLEAEGATVYPTASSLKIIQNKLTQKLLLEEKGAPVPEFMDVEDAEDIKKAGEMLGYPLVLKACTGGYDGKGNFVAKSEEDIIRGFNELGGGSLPLMAERFFPFVMEASVLACRTADGEVSVFPVAENIHRDSILFETRVPAAISEETANNAMQLAKRVMDIFDGVGMFCVELFVDAEGRLAVNEVAPRPHNSGHYTIEACATSQFEQHIRAIAGLPLGDSSLIRPAVMRNILGSGEKGRAVVLGADEALKINGVSLHIYGKEISAPKRKMGHITAAADKLETAAENAEKAAQKIKVCGE